MLKTEGKVTPREEGFGSGKTIKKKMSTPLEMYLSELVIPLVHYSVILIK